MEKVLTTGQLLTWLDENHSKLWEIWRNNNPVDDMADLHFTDWKYARLEKNEKIMQQSPELSMFTPCVDGEPIKRPQAHINDNSGHLAVTTIQYHKAKELVLFDKCKLFEDGRYVIIDSISVDIRKGLIWNKKGRIEIGTIEELAKEVNLIPTKEFLKQIGLPAINK